MQLEAQHALYHSITIMQVGVPRRAALEGWVSRLVGVHVVSVLQCLLVTLALGAVEGNTCSQCSQCSDRTRSAGSGSNGNSDIGDVPVLQHMFDGYNSLIRPGAEHGEATEVKVDIFVNSVDSISVDTMDYSINIYMRQIWVDRRLQYSEEEFNQSRVTLDHKLYDRIWVPDLFFSNEKTSSVHCVTVPNSMIRIFPNGTVLYSARYTLVLVCYMNLRYFPMDRQECFIKIESYSHTIDELNLRWRWEDDEAVQSNADLELPQFDFVKINTEACNLSYITGSYACLKVTSYLDRQYGYYMIQTYVPSMLIVSLSWVSFWINIDAVPARISLGVLTVLTLTTQSVGVSMSLPRVSYVKAIDIWMSMCVVMVFGAMLEFAVVNTLARKEIRKMSLKVVKSSKDGTVPVDLVKRMREEYQFGSPKMFDPESRLMARRVDKIARKTFPTFFIAFNIIYWCVFLVK